MIPSITADKTKGLNGANLRFGGLQSAQPNAAVKSSLLQKGDHFLDWAGANRTREMLVEDFGGFGVLRTMMDSLRGFFFGTGGFNIPAAGERLAREGFSILTDNVLAGVSAAGFGKVADARMGAYSNKWTDFSTLELFRDTIQRHVGDNATGRAAEQAFLKGLSKRMASAPAQQKASLEILQNYWNNPAQDKAALAAKLAKQLGLKSFDLRMGDTTFKLDNLLDDVGLFKQQMTRLAGQSGWRETARKTLTNTLKIKNWKLGFVGLGMAATFAVPYAINQATRRVLGINYYTGEIGLKDKSDKKPTESKTPVPSLGNTAFSPSTPTFAQSPVFNRFTSTPAMPSASNNQKRPSYVKESLQKGNFLPLITALLPLPVAIGLFDTVNWKVLKPFSKVWRNALDFSKSAPYTTQQQMAATFALLITSRLMASRSDNEFRERCIDSGLGWGLWILGTPALKRAIAGHLDKKAGQSLLLKEVPIGSGQTRKLLRTSAEIDKLASYMENITPEILAKAQKELKWLSRGSMLTSLALLGILEPFIAIQWTKLNSRKKQQQNAQAMAPETQSLPSLNSPAFSRTPQITA